MRHDEFKSCFSESKVAEIISNDEYSLAIKFENGITVKIESEYDTSSFTFDSNLDDEKRQREYEERKAKSDLIDLEKQKAILDIASKFTGEEWTKIKSTLKFI